MTKACSIWLAVYLLLAAAIGAVVYRRLLTPESAVGGGLVGGFVMWLGVAYIVGIGKKAGNSRMIRRALSGTPAADGERVAVIGRIVSRGDTLVSPLSGSACVAYKYEIRSGVGTDEFTYYDGFALKPSTIQTREGRNIRLLAWPDLNFDHQTVPRMEAKPRAEEYIRATQFQEPSIANISKAIGEMMEIYKDDDGSVRYDRRGAQPPHWGGRSRSDLDTATYWEWLLRPGDTVCAVGLYSSERGGIVPAPHPLLDPVTVERGDSESFVRRAGRGTVGYLIGGAIFCGVVLGALLALYTFVPIESAEQRSPSMIASWPEIRLENFIEKHIRGPLRHAGKFPEGTIVVSVPVGSANGRVRGAGRDEVVSRAEARGIGDLTTIQIDGDAVVLTVDRRKQPLRLRIFGQDVDVAGAGAGITELDEYNVAGRINFLSSSSMPACHVTFRARVVNHG